MAEKKTAKKAAPKKKVAVAKKIIVAPVIKKPKTKTVAPRKPKLSAVLKEGAPKKKILQGIVVSTKSLKTAVVRVETKQKHHFYKKIITKHKKYHVHDENGITKDGNIVKIISCRPISALKKWRLLEIIK